MLKYPQKDVVKIISVSNIKDNLKSRIIGREIILLDEIDSTNTYAKGLARKAAIEGTVVIAKNQIKGRGRMGRSFYSSKDNGIYMSIILRPQGENSLKITSMAAVAAANAIDEICGTKTQIKWVNDLYLGGKKICGILAEGVINPQTQMPNYVVLGIGINVKRMELPSELSDIATSIENEIGKRISRNTLISEILSSLDRLYENYEKGEFLEEYKKRSMVLGKDIKVICGDKAYCARAEDIDEAGGLIINRNGKKEVLSSGEVSIRF